MVFQGGIKAAAKMLAGLSKAARDKVIESIAKKDPKMAEALNKSMYTFDDLEHLTPLMLIELLRSINVKDMGLALRIAGPELKNLVLTNSPKMLRQEMEDILLGPPQLTSKVEEAQERIMEIVRKKIDKGELIINKESKDTLV
jgi:flagellar motor switch protein FliG